MIARPVVAGPVAGLVLGDPALGMAAGTVLEILSLHQLPVGASRNWDTGPAAVVAAAALAASPSGARGLLVAVGLGALVGWVGGWSVHALRHFNSRLVVVEGAEVQPARLAIGHVGAMGVDFARAVVLTGTGLLLAGAVAGPGPSGSTLVWGARALLLVCLSLAIGADVRAMAGGRWVWSVFVGAMSLSAIVTLWLR